MNLDIDYYIKGKPGKYYAIESLKLRISTRDTETHSYMDDESELKQKLIDAVIEVLREHHHEKV